MKRLFPDVSVADSGAAESLENWVERFAVEVKKSVSASKPAAAPAPDESKHKAEVSHLEKQVNHYKEVLAQTVRT